jgi:hypothetical protein
MTLQGANKATQSPWRRRRNAAFGEACDGFIRRDNRRRLGFLPRGKHRRRITDFFFEGTDRVFTENCWRVSWTLASRRVGPPGDDTGALTVTFVKSGLGSSVAASLYRRYAGVP